MAIGSTVYNVETVDTLEGYHYTSDGHVILKNVPKVSEADITAAIINVFHDAETLWTTSNAKARLLTIGFEEAPVEAPYPVLSYTGLKTTATGRKARGATPPAEPLPAEPVNPPAPEATSEVVNDASPATPPADLVTVTSEATAEPAPAAPEAPAVPEVTPEADNAGNAGNANAEAPADPADPATPPADPAQ